MIKSCEQCGVAFDARGRAKTCSTGCSESRRAAYMQDFRALPSSVDKDRVRSRSRYAEHKEKQTGYGRARYATDVAYRNAALLRSAARRRESIPASQCAHCGSSFRPVTTSVTCSPACRVAYRESYEASRAEHRSEYRREYRDRLRAESTGRLLAMLDEGSLRNVGGRPYFAYMFFDASGSLLYIGITDHVQRRLYQHAEDKPWFEDISAAEVAAFSNGTEARAAEAALIAALRPAHNVMHNRGRGLRVERERVSDILLRFKRDAIDVEQAKRAA